MRKSKPEEPQPNQTVVYMVSQPRWSPGIAAVLSLLWPGLGQIYKGQVLNGLVWMVMTVIGYVCFIVPGVVLHLLCIFGAARGNPNK
jgi:TM2 domain-containing membrane protein YozV